MIPTGEFSKDLKFPSVTRFSNAGGRLLQLESSSVFTSLLISVLWNALFFFYKLPITVRKLSSLPEHRQQSYTSLFWCQFFMGLVNAHGNDNASLCWVSLIMMWRETRQAGFFSRASFSFSVKLNRDEQSPHAGTKLTQHQKSHFRECSSCGKLNFGKLWKMLEPSCIIVLVVTLCCSCKRSVHESHCVPKHQLAQRSRQDSFHSYESSELSHDLVPRSNKILKPFSFENTDKLFTLPLCPGSRTRARLFSVLRNYNYLAFRRLGKENSKSVT